MHKDTLSIKRIEHLNPDLGIKKNGLPDVGSRPNNEAFFPTVSKIKTAFKFYANSDEMLSDQLPRPPAYKIRLGGGSPGNFPPFQPSVDRAIEALTSYGISYYPITENPVDLRQQVVDYLQSIAFVNDNPYAGSHTNTNGVGIDNVLFTSSTTQGYNLLLNAAMRPGDVVLMTGPNYGLFSFNPEHIGGRVEFVDLKKENNWLVNPDDVADRIDQINEELSASHGRNNTFIKDDVCFELPRVAAFLNVNPHNPTGKVMSEKHADILTALSEKCKARGVLVIDDLIYRDLTFDRENMALPISTLPGQFSNTASLFGLSKAYGLAGIRAGIVVADEIIIRAMRNEIFKSSVATPLPQSAAIAGAYNNTPERATAYQAYFQNIVPEYQFRFDIIHALVDGIDAVESDKKGRITAEVNSVTNDALMTGQLLEGIDGITLMDGMKPESGFFTVLDFTGLKNKWYYESQIVDDESLMQFLYCEANIKFLCGKSFGWPDDSQIVGRITYALEKYDIVSGFQTMKKALTALAPHPHAYQADKTDSVVLSRRFGHLDKP